MGPRCLWVPGHRGVGTGQQSPPAPARQNCSCTCRAAPGTCRASDSRSLQSCSGTGDPTQPLVGVRSSAGTQREPLSLSGAGDGAEPPGAVRSSPGTQREPLSRLGLSPLGPCPASHTLVSGQIPFPIPVHALFISFHSALTQQQPPRQRKAFLLSEGQLDLHKKLKVRGFHCPFPWMV